jgi:hypothetical protein
VDKDAAGGTAGAAAVEGGASEQADAGGAGAEEMRARIASLQSRLKELVGRLGGLWSMSYGG